MKTEEANSHHLCERIWSSAAQTRAFCQWAFETCPTSGCPSANRITALHRSESEEELPDKAFKTDFLLSSTQRHSEAYQCFICKVSLGLTGSVREYGFGFFLVSFEYITETL